MSGRRWLLASKEAHASNSSISELGSGIATRSVTKIPSVPSVNVALNANCLWTSGRLMAQFRADFDKYWAGEK